MPPIDVCQLTKSAVIGREVSEAEQMAAKASVQLVQGSVDGKMRPITRDFRPNRLVVEVRDGKVVSGSCG